MARKPDTVPSSRPETRSGTPMFRTKALVLREETRSGSEYWETRWVAEKRVRFLGFSFWWPIDGAYYRRESEAIDAIDREKGRRAMKRKVTNYY